MKKSILLALTVLAFGALVGCDQNGKEVANTDQGNKVTVENQEANSEKEVKKETGYYFADNYSGDFKHDDKTLINVKDAIGLSEEDKKNVGYGEWFRREDEQNLYFYLQAAWECGGCFSNDKYYLVIDKKTDKAELKELNFMDVNGEEARLPARGIEALLSPDKTKALFSTERITDGGKDVHVAHVYNFVTNKIERTVVIPEGKSIDAWDVMYWEVSDQAVKWDNVKKDFVINPMDEPEDLQKSGKLGRLNKRQESK